jgi:hypothetical protein
MTIAEYHAIMLGGLYPWSYVNEPFISNLASVVRTVASASPKKQKNPQISLRRFCSVREVEDERAFTANCMTRLKNFSFAWKQVHLLG